MKPKQYVPYFILFIWMGNCYCQNILIDPYPEIKVKIGAPVTFTCSYVGTGTPVYVQWFLNDDTGGLSVQLSDCMLSGTPGADYDVSRYTIGCYTLTIKSVSENDNGAYWGCTIVFGSGVVPLARKTKIIAFKDQPPNNLLLLLLLLILLLLLPIFIILICCGCLDCCKCCRIFDHYDEQECCYVTCHCLPKGCCSYFYCTPGSKMGKCFCGHENEMGRCGGCHSCQKKCRCGWPGFCKSKKMRNCGSCYCSCCVEKVVGKGLDETSVAMTGPRQKGEKL